MTRFRNQAFVCVLSLTTLFIAACENGGSGKGPSVHDPDATAHLPPSPVDFTLCSEGLPSDGNWKGDPVLADVNHDGHLDLAAHVRQGDGPRVWLGDGTGGWTESREGLEFGNEFSCGGGLTLADVNHDGHLDLIVADHCRGLFVWLGNGEGQWESVVRSMYPADLASDRHPESHFSGIECVAAGDVNGDDHIDIVCGSSDHGGVHVYYGDGTGQNWTRETDSGLNCERWVHRVRLADINGDGNLDLAASCAVGPRVWTGDGRGKWTAYYEGLPSPYYGGLFHGLRIGDVNEDGRPDLIVANWVDGPEVYLQGADGTWTKQPDVFPAMLGGACGLNVGDVDADGHLDIVVSGRLPNKPGYVYGIFWLRGDGQGNWTPVMNSGLATTGLAFTWGMALGDVNEDGLLDTVLGAGGIVGTSLKHPDPTIESGLLGWCSSPGNTQGVNE